MTGYTERELGEMTARNREAEFNNGYRLGLLTVIFATLCAAIVIATVAYVMRWI